EYEVHLQERETALRQQEQQIAANLDEKRQLLENLQAQLGTAREHLRRERADVTRLEAETKAAQLEANELRDRLRALHARFVRRFKRHWTAERRTHEQTTADLKRHEKQLQRERGALERQRRQFHTMAELDKRRLHDERSLLEQQQVAQQRTKR